MRPLCVRYAAAMRLLCRCMPGWCMPGGRPPLRVSFPKHPSEIVEISSDSEPEIIEIACSDSDDDSVVDLTL
ncbi:hypothetical protein JL722_4669 [Aureococcus anophagefferens]|nr:hypothetical protein JL722_4669 [Aureococcus anophagefferens]